MRVSLCYDLCIQRINRRVTVVLIPQYLSYHEIFIITFNFTVGRQPWIRSSPLSNHDGNVLLLLLQARYSLPPKIVKFVGGIDRIIAVLSVLYTIAPHVLQESWKNLQGILLFERRWHKNWKCNFRLVNIPISSKATSTVVHSYTPAL